MSDDDLEQRLRALRPAAPPPDLMRDLLAAESPAPGKIRWLHFALPLSAAAAIALGFFMKPERASKTAPNVAASASPSDFRVFLPIEQTSTLVEVREVAVIDRAPTRPYRLVRATWLDDITYAGDDGRSTFRRQEPRSEIIPVALEIF